VNSHLTRRIRHNWRLEGSSTFLQNLIQYHTVSVHSFHPVGLIGSVIGAWVLLLLLRLAGLERRY
jgi:uncharacterized membrane protein YeaQ/YmgE (transglycosylase-associated protein family)